MLIVENPLNDPESVIIKYVEDFDKIITIIFIIEALLKIIMLGFLFNG